MSCTVTWLGWDQARLFTECGIGCDSTLSCLLGCSPHPYRTRPSSMAGWPLWGGQTHSLAVPCPPCWHLQLTGDKELGGLQAQGSVDGTGSEDGQDDGKVAHQLPHLQMERAWPGLTRAGSCPRTPGAIPMSLGWVAMPLGWLKDAHPCREVAAAPEALEHGAGKEGTPEEQEGDEGNIGHILAAGPQEVPPSIQALGPAQPGQGGSRLRGQDRWRGGVTHGHLRLTSAPRPPTWKQGLYLLRCQERGEWRIIPCGAVT